MTILLCELLGGCASLLPRSRSSEDSKFTSFAAAREALERVQPYVTTVDSLRELGFDIGGKGAVEQVAYPQWTGRLLQPQLSLDRLDAGLRDCMSAEAPCRAYVFRFSNVRSERVGNFLLDFLNFQRVTHRHGWRFEAVVLVRGERVLFRNHGGEESVESTETRVNPLGPLQSVGERAGQF